MNTVKLHDNRITLINGDCFDVLDKIKAACIDMVFMDLPYGTTANKWDSILDLTSLWSKLHRIGKPTTPYVCTASQPFTTTLAASNLTYLKVNYVWYKIKAGNFAQGNKQPLKVHEDVLVFYVRQPTYNAQKTVATTNLGRHERKKSINRQDRADAGGIGGAIAYSDQYEPDKRLPTTLLTIPKDNYLKVLHTTQKPVELLEYFIKTYTNENDVVLDPTMGSGTTAVACVNLNRRCIGIELDETYFRVAVNRITQAIAEREQTNAIK